ncbi:MAG: carboxylating nicotinate-nucleotide diphosphorylase [Cyclobacteriaceae bacterium]|nr:carboxylating nicotinate-nucleotide diphosphorylase [Cyclobacteriaceae bacterium]
MDYKTEKAITAFIKAAIAEDIGPGDYSSLSSIPSDAKNSAQLLMKSSGIIAGLEVAERIFHFIDESLQLVFFKKDGDFVKEGDVLFSVSGKAQSILTAERLVLNCMQRMSGIATYTRYLSDKIKPYKAKVLDTRKTTPNFRIMEKWAVLIGGGQNHRFALYDMIMLKDNHVDFAGGIAQAIEATHNYLKAHDLDLQIEVETRTLAEVKQVLNKGGIDFIMLDNMSVEEMKEAVKLIDGEYKTEASGGITEDTIEQVAATGVDFISVGALTHSYKSLDMSLKAFSRNA